MQILLLKSVYKFISKNKITSERLFNAVDEIVKGKFDAHLGNGIYKQRIATNEKGKSGGYRLIIVIDDCAFCVGLFAKNELDNISSTELKRLKEFAKDLKIMSKEDIEKAITKGIFIPLNHDKGK